MAQPDEYLINEGVLAIPAAWQNGVQTAFFREDGATLVIYARTDAESFDEALALAQQKLPAFRILDQRPIAFRRGLGEMAEVTFELSTGLQHQLFVRQTEGRRSLTFHGTTNAPMPAATRTTLLQMIASYHPFDSTHG